MNEAYLNKIVCGDALKLTKRLESNSIDTIMGLPRDGGRFIKGYHYSPQNEFKKGEHWRKPKKYWNKDWLYREYITEEKSASQIARENGCGETNILYFLEKFNIPRRSMNEIRKKKYWGLVGERNGMFGRYGKLSPRWNGGHSPERQSVYARYVWKELAKSILKRDAYQCRNCGVGHTYNNKLVVHHIKPWSKYPELRFEPSNLITLCEECHKKKHKEVKYEVD